MASKSKGIVIGILIVFVVKIVMYVFKITTKAIAHVIVYLGLYIPFFYCIFGLILFGVFGLDVETMNADMTLFLAGLALSAVCALIIAVKNILVKPFSSVFSYMQRENYPTYQEEERRYYERKEGRGRRYYDSGSERTACRDTDNYPSAGSAMRERDDAADFGRRGESYGPKMPLIYYSEVEPELLIYEFDDRFEVYKDNGRQPKSYLRTEYK